MIVFETDRLIIRKATLADVEMFYALWTHPQVMRNVGFPHGLKVTRSQIENMIREQGEEAHNGRLVVILKATGEKLGEAALHLPDENGIAETDVKLLPQFWGHKYNFQRSTDHSFWNNELSTIRFLNEIVVKGIIFNN